MFKFLIFLLILASQSGANPRIKRFVGGETAEEGQFPFAASLRETLTQNHKCGAAIVSKYFLITAAHCIADYTPSDLQVYVGSLDLDQAGTYHNIYRLATYPDFDYRKLLSEGNDIGIIELKTAMEIGSNINTINLPIGITINPGDKVFATGWGYTNFTRFGYGFAIVNETNRLQYLERTILSNNECSKEVSHKIGPGQICFAGEVGRGACFGDSGSPLVYTVNNASYVIGLTSWIYNPKRCGGGHPSMYSNVSYYLTWIQKHMSKGRHAKRHRKRKTY